jgi:hypothetical protein
MSVSPLPEQPLESESPLVNNTDGVSTLAIPTATGETLLITHGEPETHATLIVIFALMSVKGKKDDFASKSAIVKIMYALSPLMSNVHQVILSLVSSYAQTLEPSITQIAPSLSLTTATLLHRYQLKPVLSET